MVITTRPPESATEGEQDSTSHQPPPLPQSWMKTIRVSAAPGKETGAVHVQSPSSEFRWNAGFCPQFTRTGCLIYY